MSMFTYIFYYFSKPVALMFIDFNTSPVPSAFILLQLTYCCLFLLLHSPSLGYSSNINCQSRQQGSMYGGGGGTPLGGHTSNPCQASRLPPHNPRLHAPPKHGHVRQSPHSLYKSVRAIKCQRTLCFWQLGWKGWMGGGNRKQVQSSEN